MMTWPWEECQGVCIGAGLGEAVRCACGGMGKRLRTHTHMYIVHVHVVGKCEDLLLTGLLECGKLPASLIPFSTLCELRRKSTIVLRVRAKCMFFWPFLG